MSEIVARPSLCAEHNRYFLAVTKTVSRTEIWLNHAVSTGVLSIPPSATEGSTGGSRVGGSDISGFDSAHAETRVLRSASHDHDRAHSSIRRRCCCRPRRRYRSADRRSSPTAGASERWTSAFQPENPRCGARPGPGLQDSMPRAALLSSTHGSGRRAGRLGGSLARAGVGAAVPLRRRRARPCGVHVWPAPGQRHDPRQGGGSRARLHDFLDGGSIGTTTPGRPRDAREQPCYAALTGTLAIRWEGARRPPSGQCRRRRSSAKRRPVIRAPLLAHLRSRHAAGVRQVGGIGARTAVKTFDALDAELLPAQTPSGDAWILARRAHLPRGFRASGCRPAAAERRCLHPRNLERGPGAPRAGRRNAASCGRRGSGRGPCSWMGTSPAPGGAPERG